jgi:alcohol dehydrogenase
MQRVYRQLEHLALPTTSANQRVLVVADPQAYELTGARERLAPMLESAEATVFSGVSPNPTLDDVQQAVSAFEATQPSAIVAIGGGSAIDLAKATSLFGAQPYSADSNHGAPCLSIEAAWHPRAIPLVAIPTTAGTGSEATHFAVVYREGVKHSLAHPSLLPDVVVLDETLTASMPRATAAASGLDAVAQAIESMWSIRATEQSIDTAEQALRMGLRHLVAAVNTQARQARRGMLDAAYLSGKAINVSRTTAAHALSYTLSSRHGIPHGMAVAVWLGPLMRLNGRADATNVTHPGGVEHLRAVLRRIASAFDLGSDLPDAMDAAADRWENLAREVGCPTTLGEWGVNEEAEIDHIVESVNEQRLANNPRTLSLADLRKLVRGVLAAAPRA